MSFHNDEVFDCRGISDVSRGICHFVGAVCFAPFVLRSSVRSAELKQRAREQDERESKHTGEQEQEIFST